MTTRRNYRPTAVIDFRQPSSSTLSWLYHRFGLSFRDVEELLAKRGILESYETIRTWCKTFTIESMKARRVTEMRATKIILDYETDKHVTPGEY